MFVLYLQKSTQDILRHCSHGTFKDKLWPSTQKALLRNPEIILQGISVSLCSREDLELEKWQILNQNGENNMRFLSGTKCKEPGISTKANKLYCN